MLPRRAWSGARLAGLGATRGFTTDCQVPAVIIGQMIQNGPVLTAVVLYLSVLVLIGAWRSRPHPDRR